MLKEFQSLKGIIGDFNSGYVVINESVRFKMFQSLKGIIGDFNLILFLSHLKIQRFNP